MRRNFILWMMLALTATAHANNYVFRNVDATNGLADNFVRDIVRDSRGYLWFSTINGLSRYDGYRTVNYVPRLAGATENDVVMVRERPIRHCG